MELVDRVYYPSVLRDQLLEQPFKDREIIYSKIEWVEFLFYELKACNITGPFNLITDCDFTLTQRLADAAPDNLVSWFGTNCEAIHPKVKGLPIGLPPSFANEGIGNTSYIEALLKKPKTIKNLVYINHTIYTNIDERKQIYNYYSEHDWCTVEGGESRVPYSQYIQNVRNHKFMISPPGAGIDCHRTWEALYLGTVPIVKTSTSMLHFKELPIIFVTDYNLVTLKMLNRMYETIKDNSLYMLDWNYWKNLISLYKEPPC